MERLARKAVLARLQGLRRGTLEVVCPDRSYRLGEPDGDAPAIMVIHRERFFSRLLWGGDDAAGDAWTDGDWSSPDPVAVLRLAVRNLDHLGRTASPLSLASRLVGALLRRLRRNTRVGSRRNVQAHYDLSNDFFRLFLDSQMVYSSAVYRRADQTLEEAQVEKLDLLCRKLRLEPGDRVLEIGTGWGAFALHAARHYGCRVTTTTISREQHDHARRAFDAAGEAGRRIALLLQDYRDLRGTYDKIVSIEMFEAVGFDFYDEFFGRCDHLLAPGGAMAMQAITMNERRFPAYRRQGDWIQRRIFPGGQLASVRGIMDSLARATRMDLFHLEDLGLHYAETLREWRVRFLRALPEVRRLGFDDRFCRMWDYYLAYCEAAFRERYIGDVQVLLTRAGSSAMLYGEPWLTRSGRTHAAPASPG